MKERGILFSAPMVKALLAGTKTVTRRIVKMPAGSTGEVHIDPGGTWIFGPGPYLKVGKDPAIDGATMHPRTRCPYGYPGDRLWVRETHYLGQWTEEHFYNDVDGNSRSTVDWCWPQPGDLDSIAYAADGDPPADRCERWVKRPSIFMRRLDSRITLEITEVRVERLQEITEEEARAEGIPAQGSIESVMNGEPGQTHFSTARMGFILAWREINGADSWAANPFVWVIAFKRVEQHE